MQQWKQKKLRLEIPFAPISVHVTARLTARYWVPNFCHSWSFAFIAPHPPFLICHYWQLYATIRTIRDYSHCSHYLLFAIRYTLFGTTSYLLPGFSRHPLISAQYVNLKNFYEISSKWSSDIGSRKYAEMFSKYFYFDKKKITYTLVHFRAYFSETNRKIVKARLTLVAYLVLIHIVQFFLFFFPCAW